MIKRPFFFRGIYYRRRSLYSPLFFFYKHYNQQRGIIELYEHLDPNRKIKHAAVSTLASTHLWIPKKKWLLPRYRDLMDCIIRTAAIDAWLLVWRNTTWKWRHKCIQLSLMRSLKTPRGHWCANPWSFSFYSVAETHNKESNNHDTMYWFFFQNFLLVELTN